MNKFKTAFMVSVGKEYNKLNWVMQLHYGTIRDNNVFRYNQLGPDTGFDCINTYDCSAEMAQFLNALNSTDELPKTIIYSLNPSVNAAIGTVIGCFQDSKAVGKIQQGSAWWFNDHKVGMTNQMTSLANLSLLAVGYQLFNSRCINHFYINRWTIFLILNLFIRIKYIKTIVITKKCTLQYSVIIL